MLKSSAGVVQTRFLPWFLVGDWIALRGWFRAEWMQVDGPGVFIRWYLLCFASCVREGRVWKGDKLGPNEPSVFSSDQFCFLKKRGCQHLSHFLWAFLMIFRSHTCKIKMDIFNGAHENRVTNFFFWFWLVLHFLQHFKIPFHFLDQRVLSWPKYYYLIDLYVIWAELNGVENFDFWGIILVQIFV